MTKSAKVETPIQLAPYQLEHDAYRRLLFWYQLPKLLIPQLGLITLLGFLESEITQSVLGSVGLWAYLTFLALLAKWAMPRKLVKNPLNRENWTSKQVEFDSNTFRIASATGSASQIPFGNFVKADKFEGYYLLFLNSLHTHIIPAKAFRSAADEMAFREVLYRHNLVKSIDKA